MSTAPYPAAALAEPAQVFAGVDLLDPRAVLARALEALHPALSLACSYSMEDVLLVAMAAEIRPDVRVFALETGRLPEETAECAAALRTQLGVTVEAYVPDATQLESLLAEQGHLGFRESLDARHACCQVRKVAPLGRALHGLQAWVTGQRRSQSVTRAHLEVLEPAPRAGEPFKINPLAYWSLAEVEAETQRLGLPRNALYAAGYQSIGCAPCTRAVAPGEDERAGRWWWEQAAHKECGLHGRPGFEQLVAAPGEPR